VRDSDAALCQVTVAGCFVSLSVVFRTLLIRRLFRNYEPLLPPGGQRRVAVNSVVN